MTKSEAVKYVKEYVRRTYGKQKTLAHHRGVSRAAICHSIRTLSPWLIEESGLAKQVDVSYVVKEKQ